MATSSTDTSSTSSKLPNSGGGSGGVLMLGLSGLSSSGKTTLGRLLQRIFAGTTLLHQDDFYLADAEIPVDAASGLADWDCAGSLDFARMRAALLHIRAHDGALPADLDSIQAGNSVGPAVVAEAVVERLVAEVGERVERWKSEGRRGGRRKLVIVDGFLLFHQGSVVEDCFDAKVLLRASYEKAKQRREARTGYVTIEGFWEDPPGYFDKIVWPNYVREHSYLFENDDITGRLKPEVVQQRRIQAPDDADMPMDQILPWAVELLCVELEREKAE